MITDEKKSRAILPLFLFYKAFCNTTEFASGQDKANPLSWLSQSSWFPVVVPREKIIFWPWNKSILFLLGQ